MPKRRQSGAAQTAQNGLLPRQETAALQLARGATLEQAAKESGAGVTTIKTWAAQPEFNRRVAELRSQMTGRVFGKIVDAVTDAVDTLREVCRGSDSEAMRVRAAEAILSHGSNAIEVADLKARLDALERGA